MQERTENCTLASDADFLVHCILGGIWHAFPELKCLSVWSCTLKMFKIQRSMCVWVHICENFCKMKDGVGGVLSNLIAQQFLKEESILIKFNLKCSPLLHHEKVDFINHGSWPTTAISE